MLKADRICTWIFIGAFALLIPSIRLLKFTDELTALLLFGLALGDCIVKGEWKKFRGLWIICGVMFFYAVYSLTCVNYNSPSAIFADMLIELKPFVPFFVFIAIAPKFTIQDKLILKSIAALNCITAGIITLCFREQLDDVIQHISYVGVISMVSAIVFIYCSTDKDGRMKTTDLLSGVLLMSIGLLGGRAKFYASFIAALYFLFLYHKGITKRLGWKIWLASGGVIIAMGAVSWYKFDYYFITGNTGRLDPDLLEAFARPIMYATSWSVLTDHIPFGSGLASFGSYASGELSYSGLYADYGINHVYGLSARNPSFICDAFYPSLAQFGFVGIGLFVYLWIFISNKLKKISRTTNDRKNRLYSIGWIIIIFLLIESIASTVIVQSGGQCAMMLLGGICARAYQTQKSNDCINIKPKTFSFLKHTSTCLVQTK